MIAILGESGSGKTTVAKVFAMRNPAFKRVVMYTTRPRRDEEVDGYDYNFASQNEFDELAKNGFFIKTSKYRDWSYGIPKAGIACNSILVLTPADYRELRMYFGKEDAAIYLNVDRRSRLIKALSRGDDIEEAYRRNLSEVGQYDGIENEVDYVIDNKEYSMDVPHVARCIEDILHLPHEEDEDGYQLSIEDVLPFQITARCKK